MNKSAIMSTAWGIAREGAARFGGKARQFFAAALRYAWKAARVVTLAPLKGSEKQVSWAADIRTHLLDALNHPGWEKRRTEQDFIFTSSRKDEAALSLMLAAVLAAQNAPDEETERQLVEESRGALVTYVSRLTEAGDVIALIKNCAEGYNGWATRVAARHLRAIGASSAVPSYIR